MLSLWQRTRVVLQRRAFEATVHSRNSSPKLSVLGNDILRNGSVRNCRWFGASPGLLASKPYLLADIGEGITECQIISWAVKPGDKVEQFEPICEVQSDKASVEITSRFEGTIKSLHYEVGDVAKVGSALLDIDVADGSSEDAVQNVKAAEAMREAGSQSRQASESVDATVASRLNEDAQQAPAKPIPREARLMPPAVRRMLKMNDINTADVEGTGKGGRILKGDVQRYMNTRHTALTEERQPAASQSGDSTSAWSEDRRVALSPIQKQMFKSMTASLSIPHFLYTHTVDLTSLTTLCERLGTDSRLASRLGHGEGTPIKLTVLPFVLKALSKAASEFPAVNSLLELDEATGNPQRAEMTLKASHNFGLAVDTPQGLLVPVVRNVQNLSILSLASEISRLGKLAKEGRLSPDDMKDGTLVVSNIGSIGGQVVAPVILSPMTAIVAVGKMEDVPAFETDKEGVERIVKKKKVTLSWSADHRVLDGATVARCAQQVAMWLENPECLGIALK